MHQFTKLLTTIALLAAPTAAAAQAQFLANVGTHPNNSGLHCHTDPAGVQSSPVSTTFACSGVRGAIEGAAFSTYGRIGIGVTTASTFPDSVPVGGSGAAHFYDLVIFTADDPALKALGFIDVAVNFEFTGTLNATHDAHASIFAEATLGQGAGTSGIFAFYSDTSPGNPFFRNDFTLVEGEVGVGLNSALLRTPTVRLALGSPQQFLIRMQNGAGAVGNGPSAVSDFANSFGLPTMGDAFVLPAGVTASSVSGGWLVNNRLVDPNAVNPIPEPATWAMLILGFGLAGSALRLTRPGSRRSAHSPG